MSRDFLPGRSKSRDDDLVPLDPDLLELARRAGSQTIIEDIYQMQAERNATRVRDRRVSLKNLNRINRAFWAQGS